MSEVRVFAKAAVTLEIELAQPWSNDEKVAHVLEVARRDIERKLVAVCQALNKPPKGAPIQGISGATYRPLNLGDVTLRFGR